MREKVFNTQAGAQVCPKYDYYKVLVSLLVDDPSFYKMMIVVVHAKLVIAHL